MPPRVLSVVENLACIWRALGALWRAFEIAWIPSDSYGMRAVRAPYARHMRAKFSTTVITAQFTAKRAVHRLSPSVIDDQGRYLSTTALERSVVALVPAGCRATKRKANP